MAAKSTARGAAFFDLDRTLLAGASGEVFQRAMQAAGLINRSIPGASLVYGLFNRVGENLPSMALARAAARVAKGRAQADMQRVAKLAADDLVAMIQPLAAPLFDEHRAAGRPVVLATTTPYDLVRPLAEALGLDDVIATRYRVDPDGTYDGTLEGPFVWSAGKLAAVRSWAAEHGVDLKRSYAYSDSVYDSPLLSAVGHPFVVNPDPGLIVLAAARRWPTVSLAEPREEGSRMPSLPGIKEFQRLAMGFVNPIMVPYAVFDISGTEHVPRQGPAIVVANHRSYFDPMAFGMAMARTGRTARFLGKKEVFDAPVVGRLASMAGGIRVDRGTGSDAPLEAAAEALAEGDIIAMMPQGTIPRGKAFFDVELKGRWGAAKLARMSRAPVIPMGIWGTEKVWPRSSRLPNVLNVLTPPKVTVRVGPPVVLQYKNPDSDTKRIMEAIMDLLPPESRVPHTPTPEELALTLPPGYRGDPGAERTRRPGRDR
jgi:putative phosphoserine phosphatase/1-acylglycerol-3-phosphate O-acyltransferase